jgi:plastocyanin
MRRSLAGLALAFGLGVAAAPAQADETVVSGRDDLTWDKSVVDIKPGDSVRWTFPGTVQFHNVWSDSPNWNLRFPGGAPSPDVVQAFADEGDYVFVCQVHADTMRGVIRVASVPPPPPPPPPPSAQAYNNDDAAAVPLESNVKVDKTKPRLASVSARRAGKRAARVRFKVSEDADVTVAFKRGRRTIKSAGASGTGTRSVTVRGLRAGRYVLQVRATDVAGNRSKLRTLRLTVR